MQVDFRQIGGTPCYTLKTTQAAARDIHGAVYDRDTFEWWFPAYAPFERRVFHDLKLAFKEIPWTPAALAQHAASLANEAAREAHALPEGFTFHTEPFDHQREGLSYLLHRPRAALLWAMGTGKSKVIVDLFRAEPQNRMLITSPKVTLFNWKKEFQIHAGSGPRVGVIAGDLEAKRDIIENYRDYDVLVTSYGTARNLAFPVLHEKTLAYLQDSKAGGPRKMSVNAFETLVRICRNVARHAEQIELVKKWESGMPATELRLLAEDLRRKTAQYLCDVDFHTLVADESHALMEASSEQTKAVVGLSRKAVRRIISSGTVTLGDPRHLYPQLKMLSSALVPEDLIQYEAMFLLKNPFNNHQVLGYKNLDLLNDRVDRVATRKTREECLTLPERQFFDLTFPLEGPQKELYNTLVKEGVADLAAMFAEGSGTLEVANSAVLLNKLGQVCSGFILEPVDTGVCNTCARVGECVTEGIKPYTQRCPVTKGAAPTREVLLGTNPKLDLLMAKLEEALQEPTNKAIIWAQHTAELNHIEQRLQKAGIVYVRVDGSTGGKVQTYVDRFNTSPDCRVYLAQIATGIGITLTSANHTFYYSMDWSLGTYLQSLDRNYRAGQVRKVAVWRFFAEDSVELFKAEVLAEKADVSRVMTGKLLCSLCPRVDVCAKEKVELFDDGCLYPRQVRRTVAKAKELT